jgi:O-antigen/teichoic acid export membrane protein
VSDDDDGVTGGSTLRALVRRGAAWSIASHLVSQLLRFGSNLLLARLLFPEAFGLMAIVNALLSGLQLFSDIGIGPSIIQNPRGNDVAFLNTAWTVQVVRGCVLWIVSCAIAWPVASFYGDPRLAWLVAVSGLTALIAGFNSTRLHSRYRNVDLARVSIIELVSQGVSIFTMIVWAIVSPSPWSLVAGGIAGSLAKLVLSFAALPGVRHRLHCERSALVQMLHFGRWIFVSTALTFLALQSDKLIFGKLVDTAMLGVYGFGVVIVSTPLTLLRRLGTGVFLPVFSRAHNSGEDLQAVFDRVRRPWLIATGWLLAGLCAGGQAAVDLLWDERYAAAGWITQLLSIGAWFGVLEMTNGHSLLARGKAKWVAASNAVKLAAMVILIPLGFQLDGFRGAVVGLVLSDPVRYVVSVHALTRQGMRSWPQDLRLTLWVLVTGWVGWQAALLGQRAHWPTVLVAASVFLTVTLAWAPLGASIYARYRKHSP